MKHLTLILTLVMLTLIGYAQPIPIPGQRPTNFPLKATLDGSEELYSQRDINGINSRRFLVSQIATYIHSLNPRDSIIIKGDSICIKGSNCISFSTALPFIDSLRASGDTLYYRKGMTWRPLLLPTSTDSIFYTGNDTLPLYTVLTTGNTPPGSPAIGATYWVGASPTGSWAGHAQNIATWAGSAWTFYAPINGDYMYNAHTGYTYQWRSPKWVQVSGIPILNGGNSLSSGVNIGSKNAKPVVLKTNNTTRMTIQPGGAININSLASNTYPLVGAESDGTLRKIYPTNDFIVDIDSLRINPAILSGGSSNISAGNGLYKSSDSIHLGGMVKSSIEFLNALNDTILGIDTLGHIYAPGLYKFEESNGGFIVDTTFTITTDYLVDSVLLSFGLLPSQFCHTPHTAGVVSKLSRKDGVLYTLDTTNTGACQDSTQFSILQLKFAGGQLPKDAFVDSFGVLFSGYDTLNVNGNTPGPGSPLIIMNQGRKVIYTHFSSNGAGDSIFNLLGDPFSIGEDTISFLNYHFSENIFNTIDSITISFIVPLGGNDDFKFFIDRVALVFPYKPVLRMVASWGGNIITIPYANATNTNYVSGNGVAATNGNAFDLGNFTDNVFVNANSKDYILSSAGQYSIGGSSITLQGNGTTNGVVLDGTSNSSNGTYIRGYSSNSQGIRIDGISQDNYGTYINGNCSSQAAPDIELYATNGNIRFSGVPTNNTATQVLAASSSSSSLVWKEVSTFPSNVTAGNGLRNIDASTVALNNNGGQPLTDNIVLNGADNDAYVWITGYSNISNYPGVQIVGYNTSPSNSALNIQGNNAGTADDIFFSADNGKLRIVGLPDNNSATALLGKTSNGLAAWVSNPTPGTSSLSTNTAITPDFSTYIMDFTSNGTGTSSNELPLLSSVVNGFTVRIRRTDNNSSFTATIIPHTGSGDTITDIDNANVSAIGISSGTTDNYIEFTAFINGVNGYAGSTKWVVMNRH